MTDRFKDNHTEIVLLSQVATGLAQLTMTLCRMEENQKQLNTLLERYLDREDMT